MDSRGDLPASAAIAGPAIIEESGATTVHGPDVRIEMPDAAGRSVFGAIDQKVAQSPPGPR